MPRVLPLLGAAWAALLLVGALIPEGLVACELLAALPWMGAMIAIRRCPQKRTDLALILGIGVLGRAVLLVAPPVLSDDLYRYLWDGRVQVAGLDPYAHAPSAPELEGLRDGNWSHINHRHVPTIYPPLAQLWFRAVAAVWPHPTGFRVAASLWDLTAAWLLLLLLRRRGSDARASLIYAWAPLTAVESAVGGHLDATAIALWVGALALVDHRRLAAGVLAGLSLSAKLGAAALLPLLTRKRGTVLVGLCIGLLPFLLHFGGPLMQGMGQYSRRWRFNESLFAPTHAAARIVVGEEPRGIPPRLGRLLTGRDDGWVYADEAAGALARGAVGVAWLGLAAWVLRRRLDVHRGGLVLLSAALFLSPVVHPWYVTWLLPLLAVVPYPPLLLFAALAPLAYLVPGAPWARFVEYGLPVLAAALLWARSKAASDRAEPARRFV